MTLFPQALYQFHPVTGIFPDFQFQRGLADDILTAITAKPGKALVNLDIGAVHPGDVDCIGTGVESDAEPLLQLLQFFFRLDMFGDILDPGKNDFSSLQPDRKGGYINDDFFAALFPVQVLLAPNKV